jgi:cytochrome c oxidase cbb3-type subunit 2
MKMTPALLIIGAIAVFWASMYIMVFMVAMTYEDRPSDIWRPMTPLEEAGHDLYVANGCSYCHSMLIRVNDWGIGSERIAQAGDYYQQRPAILGTERTGPDLSQEGGEHPSDWQLAHFTDPRFTSPISLMPTWQFLGEDKIRKLTAYVQYLGGKDADLRVARQEEWKRQAIHAYEQGPDSNLAWIHAQVPAVWLPMPNPYPATSGDLDRGKVVYQEFCIGCHGAIGDGHGPAEPYLNPPPLNFTELRRNLIDGRYLGGLLYYQIMNGITGTAMPYFKKHLESEKIWDVANYVALNFVGFTDAQTPPLGIDAAYEPPWTNPTRPPDSTGQER